MKHYNDELEKIQAQVEIHEKNRRKFANVADLMEEGSQYSDRMTEIVRDHESKLCQLEKKSKELKILTEVSNQHDDEIQNLKNSIEVMKHQKAEVTHIVRSDSAVSVNRDNSDFEQKVNHHFQQTTDTPKRSNFLKPMKSSSFTISTKSDLEELDRSRDFEEKKEIRQLKAEISLLKQKLLAKEKNAIEHLTSYRKNRFTVDEPHVPTTLNLESLPTDLSVLETTSVFPTSQAVNSRPDLNNQSERKSEHDWDTGALFGYNLGLGSMMSRQSHQHSGNYDYHSRSTKHDLGTMLQQKDRSTRRRTESQESNECGAECCNGSFFAQLFRSVFGEQKDPVVRQW